MINIKGGHQVRGGHESTRRFIGVKSVKGVKRERNSPAESFFKCKFNSIQFYELRPSFDSTANQIVKSPMHLGSDNPTSSVFERSKRGWMPNDLVFE